MSVCSHVVQVQDLVTDSVKASTRLHKASNSIIASLKKVLEQLKACNLHSTAQSSLVDWFAVKPFQMDFAPPQSIQLTGPLLYGVCYLCITYSVEAIFAQPRPFRL